MPYAQSGPCGYCAVWHTVLYTIPPAQSYGPHCAAAWDTAPHGWHTRPFFDAISACDGAALGTIILRLAPAQPHVPSAAAFVDEIARKCEAMRVSGNPANGP